MLADAITAERFRLLRDRSALFWGFCFAPIAVSYTHLTLPTKLEV